MTPLSQVATRRGLPLGPPATATTRLFCFPHAGASAMVYAGWQAPAGAELLICPVQPPGRAERGREAPLRDVDQVVDGLIEDLGDQFTGDYALFGHSVGALVAYRLARRLIESGAEAPRHLFVSGRAAPQLPDTRKKLRGLPIDELVKELRALGGIPDILLRERQLLEMFLPVLRADLAVNETYRHDAGEPLPIGLTVFGGHGDPRADDDELAAWQELTGAGFELFTYPGGHFYLEKRAADMLEIMRWKLAR